jgi:hypothetical protein
MGPHMPPFGSAPQGLFLFDGSGFFSVQIAPGDLNPIPASAPQIDEGFLATWGRFRVEEETQSFVLSIAGSNRPKLIGTELRPLEGGMALFRTEPVTLDGIESVTTITWRAATGAVGDACRSAPTRTRSRFSPPRLRRRS